jgi:hypothetical protein
MIRPLGYIQLSIAQIYNQDDEGTDEKTLRFI